MPLGCGWREELPTKGHKGTFWGDENVPYVNLGGEHTTCVCVKIYWTALKRVNIIACDLYLNKTRLLKNSKVLSERNDKWYFVTRAKLSC